MTSLGGDGIRTIDKFIGEYFNLQDFKLEMGLGSMDLWNIMDEFKRASFLGGHFPLYFVTTCV